MGRQITELKNGHLCVNSWDSSDRHWVYYFRDTGNGEYELFASAKVPYKGNRLGADTKSAISDAEDELKQEGYDIVPYEG